MTAEVEEQTSPDLGSVCEMLDKLTLKQLHLMEEKLQLELNIEANINSGSLHLAKSRYIMGHSSVSSTQLPSECSSQFSATTICKEADDSGIKQLRLASNTADDTVNPLNWFGVLVPQNLHKAQSTFQKAVDYIVDCVNVQLRLYENSKNVGILKQFKKSHS